MSYGYSSAYPWAPNSTPRLPTSIRPPIHNPYDKFTQPQFDEWIGDITGALRKALGQEEEETLESQTTQPREDAHPVSDIDEDNIEDSFAEWKAVRAREKGKMRATEDEEDSQYGGSQESHEGFDVHDRAAGNTPADAIELLSDEDDAEGEEVNDPRGYDNEDNDGDFAKGFSPVESEGEVQRPYVGSLQPAIPSKMPDFSANTAGQGAIEISDGETEDRDQGDDSFDAEDALFGWGREEEAQQPPDIRDPWELPKTYAEDLYTGGPIRETDRTNLSPSHLTPVAEEAGYFDNIDPQLRHTSVLVSQPTDHNLAEVPQGSATPTLIPLTTDEGSRDDDKASLYDEDILDLDTPTTTALRDEPDFVSFTALNQPSDTESDRGEPETLYVSDNDGGGASEDDEEAEEDEFDDGGPIPLGTSDLEIPAEHELEGDEGEELDELEDDDDPVAEVAINPPYGYYGLDASSVAGSGGLDDETGTVGPPSDLPKGEQSVAPNMAISQESTSLLDPHDLAPLPAAATFIEIDHRLQSAASVVAGDTTKASLASVSLTSPDHTPAISDEVASNEDTNSTDEDSAADNTILAGDAVLTVNEVEEVLRGAFAQADRSTPTTDAQEGAVSVADTTVEQVAHTPQNTGPRDPSPDVFAGEEPLPDEPTTKEDEHTPVGLSPTTVGDKPSHSKEPQNALPFVMPLIANPNFRDPMSAPWSPVQSEPSTPVAALAYLPAVTRFKRDNQLLGTAQTSSGLFTPLEGSGSSSPSDSVTPEYRADAEVEVEEVPVVENDEQPKEGQATSVSASPMTGSPEISEVEPEAIPTGPPEDDDWGEIPRLPTPPAEMVDDFEEDLPTGSATRVFFQPEEPSEGLNARPEDDRDYNAEGSDALPMVAADVPYEENEGVPGLDDAENLVRTTDDTTKRFSEVTETVDPFKLMGNDSTVAPGAVMDDDDDSSIASSSLDEEDTPRLKPSELPSPAAKDSEPTRSERLTSSRSLIQAQESTVIQAEAQEGLKKRKRSESIPIDPTPWFESTVGGEVSDVVAALVGNGEHKEAGHELADDGPPKDGEERESDNESFNSSLIAPRNADPSSQDGSRASSVVSEQLLLPQSHTPVPEDAPVFHGHGKFKAAMQAYKLARRTSEQTRVEGRERKTEGTEEKEPEKERIVLKIRIRKPPGANSKDNSETKKPPSPILPEVSTQPSLPSASTSQSPRTPTSTLPPSSPAVVTTSKEVTPPSHQEQTAQGPAKPDREAIQKPVAKALKRTPSRKYVPVEPKSTRSQCRYRKISLPREENGPRVTFCVPQCSLNNTELMMEEEITDDGLATVRDFERLWDHVEEQDLGPYLIGTIRQLVGLDLLRENEIYYLPTDEEIKQLERRRKREERRRSRKSIGGAGDGESPSVGGRSGSGSAAGHGSQPSLGRVERGKPGPPPPFPESISATTSTRSKVSRRGSARSISEDEMNDGERGGRAPKRRKRGGKERDGDGGSRKTTPSVHGDSAAPSTAGSPTPSQSPVERTPVRRSQRMPKVILAEAQAYKPPFSSGSESSGDELENAKTRRKSTRGGTKGLKRRRTEGAGDFTIPAAVGGAADRDAPLSPVSTRAKRAKIDEK